VILLYGIALYWGASYFSEQEAAWNQALVRDSAFTPVNIIQYYVADPIYIITGIGGLLYARTRLPTFACHGWSTAYVLLSSARSCFCHAQLSTNGGALFGSWKNWPLLRSIGASCFLAGFPLSVFGVSLLIIGRIRELSSGYEDVLGIAPSE